MIWIFYWRCLPFFYIVYVIVYWHQNTLLRHISVFISMVDIQSLMNHKNLALSLCIRNDSFTLQFVDCVGLFDYLAPCLEIAAKRSVTASISFDEVAFNSN